MLKAFQRTPNTTRFFEHAFGIFAQKATRETHDKAVTPYGPRPNSGIADRGLGTSALVTEQSLAATLLIAGDGLVPGLNDDRDTFPRTAAAVSGCLLRGRPQIMAGVPRF